MQHYRASSLHCREISTPRVFLIVEKVHLVLLCSRGGSNAELSIVVACKCGLRLYSFLFVVVEGLLTGLHYT